LHHFAEIALVVEVARAAAGFGVVQHFHLGAGLEFILENLTPAHARQTEFFVGRSGGITHNQHAGIRRILRFLQRILRFSQIQRLVVAHITVIGVQRHCAARLAAVVVVTAVVHQHTQHSVDALAIGLHWGGDRIEFFRIGHAGVFQRLNKRLLTTLNLGFDIGRRNARGGAFIQ